MHVRILTSKSICGQTPEVRQQKYSSDCACWISRTSTTFQQMKSDGSEFTKTIYGCILTLAALVGLDGDATTPLSAIVVVLVSLAAVCVAEAYAHRLGTELSSHQLSTRSQILAELQATRWILIPGILATLAIFLALLDSTRCKPRCSRPKPHVVLCSSVSATTSAGMLVGREHGA
jgi:hypothetical protein